MMTGKKQKIHSEFAIRLILFYGTMLLLLPMILVVTYVFSLDAYMDVTLFMFWTMVGILGVTAVGTGILFLDRDHLKRMVRPSYRNEFIYLLFISAFGLLGLAVMYDYLGFDRQYIANFLIVAFSLMVYLLIMLGKKFFKFGYIGKK